jgi:ubiquinol-cytochrome c reductase iron-sulfur subunit
LPYLLFRGFYFPLTLHYTDGQVFAKQGKNKKMDAEDGTSRRDFLYLTAGAMGAVAAGSAAWPLVDSMNPAKDTLALATTEIDISKVEVGQAIVAVWRGAPVFIRRRTPEEIAKAEVDDAADLRDPQKDSARVQKTEWLIVKGVCTHLGCIPLGTKAGQPRGDFGGWFCPCHGSHYDTSGRIRKGPAPHNLTVPPYTFVTDTLVRIG